VRKNVNLTCGNGGYFSKSAMSLVEWEKKKDGTQRTGALGLLRGIQLKEIRGGVTLGKGEKSKQKKTCALLTWERERYNTRK